VRSLATLFALGLLLGVAPVARAQSALAAARPDAARLRVARLTLRPEPALAALAAEVSEVLELRGGMRVAVGEPPPPGLPEAVPASHVALLQHDDRLQLVIGMEGGRSLEASVQYASGGALPDPRALALAVEALEDAAAEQVRALQRASAARAQAAAIADAEPSAEPLAPPAAVVERPALRDTGEGSASDPDAEPEGIQPLVNARSYVGVSPATTGAVLALATGVGLCAIGYCLVIQGEFPVNGENTSASDVRYRYMTFGTGLHAQPLRFGRLRPAANLLLVTRFGHFGRDMGMPAASDGSGMDTDLAARASLELGVEVVRRVDALLESGVDLTIDGWQVSGGGSTVERGNRAVPWLQAGVRFRPY
jgi:hypothetical protein